MNHQARSIYLERGAGLAWAGHRRVIAEAAALELLLEVSVEGNLGADRPMGSAWRCIVFFCYFVVSLFGGREGKSSLIFAFYFVLRGFFLRLCKYR